MIRKVGCYIYSITMLLIIYDDGSFNALCENVLQTIKD